MNIFVINSGSSSIKYQLISMPSENVICSGLIERIGLLDSMITHQIQKKGGDQIIVKTSDIENHEAGLLEVASLLIEPTIAVISNPDQIDVVGHRVVHGGEQFAATAVITAAVKEEIRKLFPLAPLHNPANYMGIEVAEKIFPNAKQVAVFDTAFHQTMPEKAFRYAIPNEFYQSYGVRAYGFHGTSHKYVSEKAIELLGADCKKIITIHLGNGCSMAAIENGKCIDTSMGMGPMNGLIMGTRAGDIDQSIIFHLVNQLGLDLAQVNTLLNKKSGMLGLTGFSDMRDVESAVNEEDKNAILASEMYAYRIKKYIGSYMAALNGLDAIVFTAGVGENDQRIRKLTCRDLDGIGIILDSEKNKIRSKEIREINAVNSKVKIVVVPTNEELEIAKQCFELVG